MPDHAPSLPDTLAAKLDALAEGQAEIAKGQKKTDEQITALGRSVHALAEHQGNTRKILDHHVTEAAAINIGLRELFRRQRISLTGLETRVEWLTATARANAPAVVSGAAAAAVIVAALRYFGAA